MSTPGSEQGPLVAHVGERGLIERIRERAGSRPDASLIVGIGDDAAVVRPERGAMQVLTTDALVEGVHFDRRFSSLRDVGFKALAVNVSDIAAMGAAPAVALLSLILPENTTTAGIDALVDGFLDLAASSRVTLAGGNISSSPGPLVVDVTVTGAVRERRILRRSGGRPGDAIYVTGEVGSGAAGLSWLRADGGSASSMPDDEDLAGCVMRYRRPDPRMRMGALLGRTRSASACMDLSDGLADAVRQIAAASGTGARVDASLLPLNPGANRWFEARGVDPIVASITGGDDYELLFTVPPRSRGRLRGAAQQARGLRLTRIGELTEEKSISLVRAGRSVDLPAGFVHF